MKASTSTGPFWGAGTLAISAVVIGGFVGLLGSIPVVGNLLVQSGKDVTNLSVTGAADAQTSLSATDQALAAVTNYAASIGATLSRLFSGRWIQTSSKNFS